MQVYIWREVINLLAAQTKAKTIPYHFQLDQVFIEKSLSFESPLNLQTNNHPMYNDIVFELILVIHRKVDSNINLLKYFDEL